MRLSSKEIIERLWISREAFYKNNRKTTIFNKISRGIYEVEEEQFVTLEKYYALKNGFNIWTSVSGVIRKTK